MSKQFWMVWNPIGGAPTKRHDNLESARKEAERLALSHPGTGVVVLESLERFTAPRNVNVERFGPILPGGDF